MLGHRTREWSSGDQSSPVHSHYVRESGGIKNVTSCGKAHLQLCLKFNMTLIAPTVSDPTWASPAILFRVSQVGGDSDISSVEPAGTLWCRTSGYRQDWFLCAPHPAADYHLPASLRLTLYKLWCRCPHVWFKMARRHSRIRDAMCDTRISASLRAGLPVPFYTDIVLALCPPPLLLAYRRNHHPSPLPLFVPFIENIEVESRYSTLALKRQFKSSQSFPRLTDLVFHEYGAALLTPTLCLQLW